MFYRHSMEKNHFLPATEQEETALPSRFRLLLCFLSVVAVLAPQPDRLDALIWVCGAADDPVHSAVRHTAAQL